MRSRLSAQAVKGGSDSDPSLAIQQGGNQYFLRNPTGLDLKATESPMAWLRIAQRSSSHCETIRKFTATIC